MAELGLSDDAYRTYREFERDEARWPVLDVVEDAFADLDTGDVYVLYIGRLP